MSASDVRKLTVNLRRGPGASVTVGTLAERSHRIYFEYDPAFLGTGLQLSPFKLPAESGLLEHADRAFGPLPGVFDDSLPDGWGLLLVDRHFRRQGVDPASCSPLDRLAYLGERTMGALTYHPPSHEAADDAGLVDLHALGLHAEAVFEGDAMDVLPDLLRAGGSPGGARPKAVLGVAGDRIRSGEGDLPDDFLASGGEHWIVKFAARADARDAGPCEYAYSLMARAAGIDVPPTRLFDVGSGRDARRYFGARRFDRPGGNRRVHVHTFANLIHADFRIPSTDYADLFKVTRALTRNHRDVQRLFRLMVFNVAAHNRDDHAKNFAFLFDDETGEWSLSPAYDLTCAPGPGGEHSTTLLGEGRAPARAQCLELANAAGLKARESTRIIDEVNDAAARWPAFADEAGCSRRVRAAVQEKIASI